MANIYSWKIVSTEDYPISAPAGDAEFAINWQMSEESPSGYLTKICGRIYVPVPKGDGYVPLESLTADAVVGMLVDALRPQQVTHYQSVLDKLLSNFDNAGGK